VSGSLEPTVQGRHHGIHLVLEHDRVLIQAFNDRETLHRSETGQHNIRIFRVRIAVEDEERKVIIIWDISYTEEVWLTKKFGQRPCK
jgi:hypothetical protein